MFKLKTPAKWLLLIGMICFIFPFVMVSCSGEHVKASGFELMTAYSFQEDMEFEEEDTPNIYLLTAFALGLVGLFLGESAGKKDKKMLASGASAFIGAFFLILFRSDFWKYYQIEGYRGMVTIEFQWGWYFSLITYISSGICAFLAYYSDYQAPKTYQTFTSTREVVSGHQAFEQSVEAAGEKHTNEPDGGGNPLAEPKVLVQIIEGEGRRLLDDFTLPCYIGRDANSCQILIDGPAVSRIQAQLFIENGAVFLEDMKSANGTILNGKKITEATEVLSGDDAVIGNTHIVFIVSE